MLFNHFYAILVQFTQRFTFLIFAEKNFLNIFQSLFLPFWLWITLYTLSPFILHSHATFPSNLIMYQALDISLSSLSLSFFLIILSKHSPNLSLLSSNYSFLLIGISGLILHLILSLHYHWNLPIKTCLIFRPHNLLPKCIHQFISIFSFRNTLSAFSLRKTILSTLLYLLVSHHIWNDYHHGNFSLMDSLYIQHPEIPSHSQIIKSRTFPFSLHLNLVMSWTCCVK